VKEGAELFAKRCEVCHGKNGENGITHHLVAGQPGKPFRGPFYGVEKDGPSYFPYPTIAWDYINRAMPGEQSGNAQTKRSLCAGGVPVLPERHHQRDRL
jgi:cytochrome c